MAIVRKSNNDYAGVIELRHIITGGWLMSLWLGECSPFYKAFYAARENNYTPISIEPECSAKGGQKWSRLGSLSKLKEGKKNSSTMIFVHDISGTAGVYSHIINSIEVDNPIYGLSIGIDFLSSDMSLENIVESYINPIISNNTHDSFIIVGWSIGGIFARALADRLELLNHKVNKVIMIDTFRPGSAMEICDDVNRVKVELFDLYMRANDLEYNDVASSDVLKCADVSVAIKLCLEKFLLKNSKFENKLLHIDNMLLLKKVAEEYVPNKTKYRIVLYAASESVCKSRVLGWDSEIGKREIELRVIEANHLSIVKPPAVKELVKSLRNDVL
jgi:thioesterase domain-containing protein